MVVEPAPSSSPGPFDADRARETSRALARLGGEVELHVARDAHTCLTVCGRFDVDLVVLDDLDPQGADQVLGALGEQGPPVVVVSRSGGDARAIEAFRLGAAECLRAGTDYLETLPVVALEQIRRYREERDRGARERRIRWLERLNDAIVTEIPAALAVVDGRGRMVTVNPAFARAFDDHAGESGARAVDDPWIGKPLASVLPADLAESACLSEILAEGHAGRASAPRLGRTGSGEHERVFDVRGQRLDDEGRILLVLSDVSERERLIKRVEDLRRYADNIIQNMNSALVVVDPAGAVTFANATASQILEVEGSMVGRPAREWFTEDARGRPLIGRTLEEGVRFRGAEAMVRLASGRAVPIGISCAPLFDGDGTRLGAVAIFQDLTEIKQLQRQVLQTEKMASIGQLAAGVAHEINNPMGFIHANLSQLTEYLADLKQGWTAVDALTEAIAGGGSDAIEQAAAALRQTVDDVDVDYVLRDFGTAIRESQEGSERIRHIVKDLRDFSHTDTGEWEGADVNQCVDSTASIVWTMMKHTVTLKKEYAELPPIQCYPMQLKQVFMNLLVNAYQAIESKVGRSGETGEIHIRTWPAREGVVVSIRDSGVGIAPEQVARIFDPFFTTKEVGAGTGLGLSTSFSIVQRHGGTIAVESQVGEGTTFDVWLPLVPAPAPVADGD